MDDGKIRRLLKKHHPAAFGWALHCCRGDRDEAEEVLHTSYVTILSRKATFKGQSAFKTWLFGVIRKTASGYRRRVFRHLKFVERFWYQHPNSVQHQEPYTANLAKIEIRKHLAQLLDCLSERQREVLHLVFYQELTIEEAAQIMGISVGSARTHYHRGKKCLRRQMESRGLSHAFEKG